MGGCTAEIKGRRRASLPLFLFTSFVLCALMATLLPGTLDARRFQSLPEGTPAFSVIDAIGPPLKIVKSGARIEERWLIEKEVKAPSIGRLFIYRLRLSPVLVLLYFNSEDQLAAVKYVGG